MPSNGSSGSDSTPLRVLIAERDDDTGTRLEQLLSQQDHAVTSVSAAEAARRRATRLPPYDVLLLSTSLHEGSGLTVLRDLRAASVDTPVIVLSNAAGRKNAIRAFELGADDFMEKPFDVRELVARMKVVYRRSRQQRAELDDTVDVGETTIYFRRGKARRNGTEIGLTDLETDLLKYLVTHRGRTVTREELLRDVWGLSANVETRTVDRHIAALRKKIEPEPDEPRRLQTVYGVGYKFVD